MYVLFDRRADALLRDFPQARWICRYSARTLVRIDSIPEALSGAICEVLDDPHICVHARSVEICEGSFDLGSDPHTLVRFIGPMAPEWRRQLDLRQVKVLFWCPRFGACLRFPDEVRSQKIDILFPFIAGARPYLAEDCTRGLTAPSAQARRMAGIPDEWVDIICFSREDRLRVEMELERLALPVFARSSCKLRVGFDGDRQMLRNLVGVKLADTARAPVLLGNSILLQTIGAVADAPEPCPYRGSGQILAVADSGLDRGTVDELLHADFQGRVRDIASWPTNASWAPYTKNPSADDGAADRNTGHGTHVAGLALGSGARSDGKHAGVAPEALLVFQAIEQYVDVSVGYRDTLASGYYLSGRPLDLRELFGAARTYGARIHINAWGDSAQGQYTDDSYEADLFLREHPDALILFAAGNEGVDQDGDRTLDRNSLYAPASAKNVVAVGAVEGGVLGIGFRGNWGDLDADSRRFLNPTDRQDPISGEPDRIALFSSAGPSVDGRIKPDVCAPGTNLAAPRSSMTQGRGWGLASPMPYYMYYGGTSMATGVAGGFAALLRQAWQQHRGGRPPSGMALKALMILGAQPVLRRADNQPEPCHVAGFGRLYFNACRPDPKGANILLFDETEPGLMAGETSVYPVHMPVDGPFRAVLAWYDAPGETLVNDLDLCLVDGEGRPVWGNHGLGGPSGPDRHNTVELIHLPQLLAGTYRLEVIGANIPEPPQAFALAICLPPARSCAIPTRAFKGIGPRYAQRLADQGITLLDQLLDRAAQLADLLQISGNGAELLRSRLQLLQSVVSAGRPQDIKPSVTLHALLNSSPPADGSPEAWHNARQTLTPLRLVFNKSSLKTITLQDLFG
ncbi:MAG: S8 family serine peptidase [Desulfobacterales bacterium]|nr:S8 family serine peptidase [Desulfobacterales bacterium]